MHVVDDQLMLSLRVGNVRSKTFLNPSARLVLAMEVEENHCHLSSEDGKPLCLVVSPAPNLGMPSTISAPASLFSGCSAYRCMLCVFSGVESISERSVLRAVQDLPAEMSAEAMACLSLGLPATVSHIIDEQSPLANLSIQKMAARRMEVSSPAMHRPPAQPVGFSRSVELC